MTNATVLSTSWNKRQVTIKTSVEPSTEAGFNPSDKSLKSDTEPISQPNMNSTSTCCSVPNILVTALEKQKVFTCCCSWIRAEVGAPGSGAGQICTPAKGCEWLRAKTAPSPKDDVGQVKSRVVLGEGSANFISIVLLRSWALMTNVGGSFWGARIPHAGPRRVIADQLRVNNRV